MILRVYYRNICSVKINSIMKNSFCIQSTLYFVKNLSPKLVKIAAIKTPLFPSWAELVEPVWGSDVLEVVVLIGVITGVVISFRSSFCLIVVLLFPLNNLFTIYASKQVQPRFSLICFSMKLYAPPHLQHRTS